MRRKVDAVVLCEDRQHAAFVRRFLRTMGWHPRRIRVKLSPSGRGSGEQFARETFPGELRQLRKRAAAGVLVVMIDGDASGPAARKTALDNACQERGVRPREADEAVAVLVPTWRIETWLAYLDGHDVDETNRYPTKLARQRDCRPHVAELAKMCRQGELREPAPPSLLDACEEFNTRLKSRVGG